MAARTFLDARGAWPPAAREAVLAALEDGWADPRRLHSEGRRAAGLVDASRAVLAKALGCRTEEIRLTASHSVSLHQAVDAVAAARRRHGSRVGHSAGERSAPIA
ncbi:MAG TPA: aminotransferase, partial [Actinotalea sp.]|nr:aminotransferase [Actinotalea sp.]